MVVPLDREYLLAAVERSPEAFTAHDRDGLVGAFATDARVDDPVGSQPHVGYEQIYRFYDTFIGPRDITFHRDLDIVFGTVVLRDLELEVAMGPSVTMYIPAFLRYDLREANGEWRIAGLGALGVAGHDAAVPANRMAGDIASPPTLARSAGQPGTGRHRWRHDRLSPGGCEAVLTQWRWPSQNCHRAIGYQGHRTRPVTRQGEHDAR